MSLDVPTFNIHEKLRARELYAARPGAHVHRARALCESVLPNHTVRFPSDAHRSPATPSADVFPPPSSSPRAPTPPIPRLTPLPLLLRT